MPQRGILVVLSGPSGTGKGTICQALRQESPIRYSISATTRKPREGEQHGREYFFLEKAEFEDLMPVSYTHLDVSKRQPLNQLNGQLLITADSAFFR